MTISFEEFELSGWESVAASYHKNFGEITNKAASVLIDKALIQERDKVLDVACGPGYVAACALKKGAEVIGVDFSSAMIQEAKKVYPSINFQVMDAEKLQFENDSFDTVLINFGVLHFANPKKAIQEALRILKPGGKFLYTIWDKPEAFDMLFEAVEKVGDLNIPMPKGPDIFQLRDINYSKEILAQIGCHKIKVEQVRFLWELDNVEEFFKAFFESGVRIGGLLRSQKPDVVTKIKKVLEEKMKAFMHYGKLQLSIPVLFFKAVKI